MGNCDMPIYEFKCKKHGTFTDVVPAGVQMAFCPKCNKLCDKTTAVLLIARTPNKWGDTNK